MQDKIRALLSKTVERGCTQEEELAALAKARALMDAYEISDTELNLTKEESAILRAEPPGTADPHGIKFNLSVAVAKFTDCEVWRDHKNKGGGLTFCGLPSDVRLATWMLDHLANFVKAELANHLMGCVATGMPRKRVINSFVDGVTYSISKRLHDLCKPALTASAPATANNRALVVVKQNLIKAKLKELGIKLRVSYGSGRQHDTSSLNAGGAAGDRASFGRPVSGQAGALRIGRS